MTEQLLISFYHILFIFIVCIGIAVVILSSWYDFRAIGQKKHIWKIAKKLYLARQLSILVVVYAHNNADTIEQCIRRIRKSTYKRYTITVINNASLDETGKIIAKLKKRQKKSVINVITKKIFISRSTALQIAYKKSRDTDLVLHVDADTFISTDLLRKSASCFINDPTLETMRFHRMYAKTIDVTSLLHRFIYLSQNLFDKATSFWLRKRIQLDDANLIFKYKLIADKNRNTTRSIYSDFITATSHSPHSRTASRAITMGISFFTLLSVAYFMYLAMTLQSNQFLTISWSIVCLWLIGATWSNTQITFAQKAELSLCIPIMYFIIFSQLLINITAHIIVTVYHQFLKMWRISIERALMPRRI